MEIDRIPPQNIEAEQATLGAILQDYRMLEDVSEFLQVSDFYRYGEVYSMMLDLRSRDMPVDDITLLGEFRRLELDWTPLDIFNLRQKVGSAAHAVPYARMVKEQSIRRSLVQAGYEIAALAQSDLTIEELSEKAGEFFSATISMNVREEETVPQALSAVTDAIEKAVDSGGRLPGLSTGFSDLDRKTNGMKPGQLIVIGAATGLGKTSIAMNIAANVCRRGGAVAVFSLEMDKRQLLHRMLCSEAEVDAAAADYGSIDGDELAKIGRAAGYINEWSLTIDGRNTNALQIRSACRKLAVKKNLSLIVVDYLQLMDGHKKADNRAREVGDMAHALKQLATELNVPVIALSQINRDVENRAIKVPTKADLRESGDIENDADQIWLLYSENYYKRHKTEKNVAEVDIVDVIIAKNRGGINGVAVKMIHHPKWTKFDTKAEI